MDAEGFGGDVFDGVGFVQDDEVAGEDEVGVVGQRGLLGRGEEGEEEGVIEDEDIGLGHAAADVLIDAAAAGGAAARGAGMGLAADEGPDAGTGGEVHLAEGGGGVLAKEVLDELQLGGLAAAEEIATVGVGVFQPGGAEVVAAAFEQLGMKGTDDLFDDRDVLVDELLMKVDRVRADDGFAPLLEGEFDGGDKIGQGLADPRCRLNNERAVFFQGPGDELRHVLLLRAIFKLRGLGELTLCGKGMMHPLRERGAARSALRGLKNADHPHTMPGRRERASDQRRRLKTNQELDKLKTADGDLPAVADQPAGVVVMRDGIVLHPSNHRLGNGRGCGLDADRQTPAGAADFPGTGRTGRDIA